MSLPPAFSGGGGPIRIMKIISKAKLSLVVRIAAEDAGVDPHAIMGRSRSVHVTKARKAASIALRRMGYSLPEIGRALGVHHTSVYHAVRDDRPKDFTPPIPDYSGEWAI
jgi:chromosomal replication initiation ATPase DnaA